MNEPVKPDSVNIMPYNKKLVELKPAPDQVIQDSEKTLSPADDTHYRRGIALTQRRCRDCNGFGTETGIRSAYIGLPSLTL